MKILLILVYSVVLFFSIAAAIFGMPYARVVIFLAVSSFIFVDWDNMPWLKLKWKN
jgi:hypothetical protein